MDTRQALVAFIVPRKERCAQVQLWPSGVDSVVGTCQTELQCAYTPFHKLHVSSISSPFVDTIAIAVGVSGTSNKTLMQDVEWYALSGELHPSRCLP